MIDRRGFLAGLGFTLLASASPTAFGLTRTPFSPVQATSTPVVPQTTSSTFDIKLQTDMNFLSKRVYSEEGIPMILACEDLTEKKRVVPANPVMSRAVVAAFQSYVDAWQRMHPNAPAGDAAKLIECLSYRDFSGGGKDDNL